MENPPAPETLITESDVEQKFTWPLLTGLSPHGLGLTAAELFTKPDIRAFEIEKGLAAKRSGIKRSANARAVSGYAGQSYGASAPGQPRAAVPTWLSPQGLVWDANINFLLGLRRIFAAILVLLLFLFCRARDFYLGCGLHPEILTIYLEYLASRGHALAGNLLRLRLLCRRHRLLCALGF